MILSSVAKAGTDITNILHAPCPVFPHLKFPFLLGSAEALAGRSSSFPRASSCKGVQR